MNPDADTGLGDRSAAELERLDRAVVVAATVTSGVFIALIALVAAVMGSSEVMQRAVAPSVVFGVGVCQLYWRRPNALFQLAVGGVVIIGHVSLVGRDPTALLGLLAMCITGVLFVRRWIVLYVVGCAALLTGLGIWWAPPMLPLGQKLLMSTGPPLLLIFTSLLVHWMRKELEQGRARYRNLFYRAPVPIWEIDYSGVGRWVQARRADGVADIRQYLKDNRAELTEVAGLMWVSDVNDAGVDFLGARSRETTLGAVAPDRLPAGYLDAFIEHVVSIWEGRSRTIAEVVGISRDGNQVEGALTSSAPIRDGGLDLSNVVTTVTDVTERKRTERRLQELVRSKDEFVASVSHEVRTPLTAVIGLAEELRDRYEDFAPGEVRDLVSVIAEQSTEVAHIVEDLLVAARKDVGSLALDKRRIDLRCEVLSMISGFKTAVEADVDLEALVPLTCADPARVRQVMRNLLVNAQRYGGGTVRVFMRWTDMLSVVEVRDAEPPIPAMEREAIFDPYYRSHRVDGVTASVGLGLTVSRQLARLMGGDVTYRHDGHESVFALTLPNVASDQAMDARTSPSVSEPISASS